jgi:hypothetical protein
LVAVAAAASVALAFLASTRALRFLVSITRSFGVNSFFCLAPTLSLQPGAVGWGRQFSRWGQRLQFHHQRGSFAPTKNRIRVAGEGVAGVRSRRGDVRGRGWCPCKCISSPGADQLVRLGPFALGRWTSVFVSSCLCGPKWIASTRLHRAAEDALKKELHKCSETCHPPIRVNQNGYPRPV